jgi:hypothetical protein
MATTEKKPVKISLGSTVVAISDQVSSNLEDEAVILNLRDGIYYGLNPVGARIWNLLQETRKVSDIRDLIIEEYEVDPQRGEQDLLEILQEMSARGLIEVKDA